MSIEKDAKLQVERFLALIDDAYVEATRDDAKQELEDEGTSVAEAAGRLRNAVGNVVVRLRKRALEQARETRRRRLGTFAQTESRLPLGRAEQLALLHRVQAMKPALSEGLTIQHRQLADLSPEDVESMLRQLDALGVLDELGLIDE